MTTSIGFDIFARDRASKQFDQVGKKVDTTRDKFSKFGAIAGAAVAGAGIALAGFAVSAIKKASDLNETINKSNVIFGANAGAIDAWARGASTSMGLSRRAALEAAAGFGNMFTQLGFAAPKAADMSKAVVQLSADLGSFNNLPTAAVTEMISAAFRGEYDSLQRLIPNISAARVQQVALTETGKTSITQLTAQEKAHATLSIIQKDGAAAAGDFARTSGGLANQTKIARARFDDLSATIGMKLLPAITTVLGKGLEFADWLDKNPGKAKIFGAAIGGLAVAIGLATVAMVALNLAFLASPIGLVIGGIALVAAGFIYAYTKSKTFRDIVNTTWHVIAAGASWLWNSILKPTFANWGVAMRDIGRIATWLWNGAIAPALRYIIRGVANVMEMFARFFRVLGHVPGFGWATTAANKMDSAARKARQLADNIRNIPSRKNVSINIRVSGLIAANQALRVQQEIASLRQHGGPITKGKPYIVGEQGPELIYPTANGYVFDTDKTKAIMAGQVGRSVDLNGAATGGGEIVIHNYVYLDGQQVAQSLRRLKRTTGVELGLA